MLLIGALAIYALLRQQMNNPTSRYRWDGMFLRLPLVGDLVAKIEVARFSRSLGTFARQWSDFIERALYYQRDLK